MDYLHALSGVFSLLVVCLLGMMLDRIGFVSRELRRVLPRVVTCVALPPYLFHSIATTFEHGDLRHLLLGAVVPVISILLTFAAALCSGRLLHVDRRRFGLYCATFSCSSAVFVGIPLCDALLGPRSIPYALLYYFANAAFFWTIGSYLIASDAPKKNSLSHGLALKALCSPPMLGFLAGLVTALLDLDPPVFIMKAAAIVGQLTTPLALLYIGFSLSLVPWRSFFSRDLAAVFCGRLILCPLLTALVVRMLHIEPFVGDVFVLQAALPAVIQAPILSAHHETDAQFGTLVVTTTTIGCVLTLPLIMSVI